MFGTQSVPFEFVFFRSLCVIQVTSFFCALVCLQESKEEDDRTLKSVTAKLRSAEGQVDQLTEQLEEEELAKTELQKQLAQLTAQVSYFDTTFSVSVVSDFSLYVYLCSSRTICVSIMLNFVLISDFASKCQTHPGSSQCVNDNFFLQDCEARAGC